MLFSLLLFLNLASAEPIAPDYKLHVISSYALSQSIEKLLVKNKVKYPVIKSAIFTYMIGIAKEMSDEEVSEKDLQANNVGILTSAAFSIIMEF